MSERCRIGRLAVSNLRVQVRAYLIVIDRFPDTVEKALKGAA